MANGGINPYAFYQAGFGKGSGLLSLVQGFEAGSRIAQRRRESALLAKQQAAQERQQEISNDIGIAKLELQVAGNRNYPLKMRVESINSYRSRLKKHGINIPGEPVTESMLDDNNSIITDYAKKSLEIIKDIKSPSQYGVAGRALGESYAETVAKIGDDKSTLSAATTLHKGRVEAIKGKALAEVSRAPDIGTDVVPAGQRGPFTRNIPDITRPREEAIAGALEVGVTPSDIAAITKEPSEVKTPTNFEALAVKLRQERATATPERQKEIDREVQELGILDAQFRGKGLSGTISVPDGKGGFVTVSIGEASKIAQPTPTFTTQVQKETYAGVKGIQELFALKKKFSKESFGIVSDVKKGFQEFFEYFKPGSTPVSIAGDVKSRDKLFRQANLAFAEFVKDLTGVQFSEKEAKRLKKGFPNEDDNYAEFQNKLEDLIDAHLRSLVRLSRFDPSINLDNILGENRDKLEQAINSVALDSISEEEVMFMRQKFDPEFQELPAPTAPSLSVPTQGSRFDKFKIQR
jgi:hypothetical protein